MDSNQWIIKKLGLGATLYIFREKRLLLAGFFSGKLSKHQVTWLPYEIEAHSIVATIEHFSPYITQSHHRTYVLTDSKLCVQALDKLARGEFLTSPQDTSLLSTASRFQVTIQHLAGSASLPSHFASRNAPTCTTPLCQLCSFVNESEASVVRGVSAQGTVNNTKSLAFTTISAWREIPNQCCDLCRVHAHLTQGTRPSKTFTNTKDIKCYLTISSISKDGLRIVRHDQPFSATMEAIIFPRSVLDGFLTALRILSSVTGSYTKRLLFLGHGRCPNKSIL